MRRNRSTSEVRCYRRRSIQRRMAMIRWMDLGWEYPVPGHLSKRFPSTSHVFCAKDWSDWCKNDSLRRNRIIERISDAEQLQLLIAEGW